MGFNPETQSFTPDNHELLPVQAIEYIYDMQPGDVRYVYGQSLLFERKPNHPVWINEYADAFTADRLMDMGDKDSKMYARVIKVDEGIVVDVSHLHKYSWNEADEKIHPDVWPSKEIERNVSLIPVIHTVWNKEELSLVTPAIESQYNINLAFYDIEDVLAAIEGEDDDDDDVNELEYTEDDGEEDGQYASDD
jgi:hypothetical protein